MEFRVYGEQSMWNSVSSENVPVLVFAHLPAGTLVEFRYAANGDKPASEIKSFIVSSADINPLPLD